jgi:hypothetical protein
MITVYSFPEGINDEDKFGIEAEVNKVISFADELSARLEAEADEQS